MATIQQHMERSLRAKAKPDNSTPVQTAAVKAAGNWSEILARELSGPHPTHGEEARRLHNRALKTGLALRPKL